MTTDVATSARAQDAGKGGFDRSEVEDFLYDEAELLDQWRLHEWLDLFSSMGRYLIPSTDLPDGNPLNDLFLVQDDRFLLEQRVNSLLTRAAHAEYPHSSTRRLIGNVRGRVDADDRIEVRATFAVYRSRNGILDTYTGQYRHILTREDGQLRFLERKSVLNLDALRPQGKISIIL